MNVTLPRELLTIANKKVAEGWYDSPDDLICEAVRLLLASDLIGCEAYMRVRGSLSVRAEAAEAVKGVPRKEKGSRCTVARLPGRRLSLESRLNRRLARLALAVANISFLRNSYTEKELGNTRRDE
jgi:Arc/MetJ-type ribon-helix-helix transcriptional regulator